MSKILLTIALLFCGNIAFSQIYTPQIPTVYGSNNNRIKAGDAVGFPTKDTALLTNDLSPQIFYRPIDSSFWGFSQDKRFFKIGSGGSGTYTASNGLTMTGNNATLGGTLIDNTTINTGTSFNLNISGNSNIAVLEGQNNGTGSGIYGYSNNGTGVYGNGLSGVVGISTTGTGVVGNSTSGLAGLFQITPSSNNTINTVIQISNNGSAGTSSGFGSSIDFDLRNDNSISRLSNQLISKWTTSTDASRTSEFSITGVNNAVTGNILRISGNGNAQFYGTVQLKNYTVATLPTGVQGMTAYVTDAAATPTWGGTATGGGSTVAKVFYNG